MSSIASSGGLVSSGGPYYMISRALGARSQQPEWPEKGRMLEGNNEMYAVDGPGDVDDTTRLY